ncbi:hypothetical protein [Caballeronia mineralivorans]|uniref:hypothetical protein n=1 Tax=Caballeronia mineralivorans TaxID=2010198 RepID=UPI0023F1A61B|nr:hypothetical protein [Caballeronia mineralivorans]
MHNPEVVGIAFVAENGDEFYGESSDFDHSRCSDFVRAMVLPQLGTPEGRTMPYIELGRKCSNGLGAFRLATVRLSAMTSTATFMC